MTTYLMIRHGDSLAGERIPGRLPDIHLSENGREQVLQLSDRLAPFKIDLICSSPLERTKETAEILARPRDMNVRFIQDLIEVDFGDWTGSSFSELRGNRTWHAFHSFRSGTRIPGGELILEVQMRMVRVLERLRDEYRDGTVAIVSHGDPIRAVVAYYSGIAIDNMLKIAIDTAGLTILVLNEWGPELTCINNRPDLALKPRD